MSAFDEIAIEQSIIEAELVRIAKEEGFDSVVEFTERILVDHVNEAVWYQVSDKGYTSWVTRAYPQFAAYGETLVGADDEEECLSYLSDREGM